MSEATKIIQGTLPTLILTVPMNSPVPIFICSFTGHGVHFAGAMPLALQRESYKTLDRYDAGGSIKLMAAAN